MLKEEKVINITPNRENVRFCVIKAKKDFLFDELEWLVNCVKVEANNTPNTIIFCNTMNDIASVTNHLLLKLGSAAYYPTTSTGANNCLIGIYHSCSWEHQKRKVENSLKGTVGVRVVVASTALSMGVNFPDVRYIINWGPARDILTQHQEIGRAGRDGKLSHSIVLYHGQQLSQCEQAVKDFVKANGCLRMAAYKSLDPSIEPNAVLHNCCRSCALSCKCAGNDCQAEKLPFEVDSENTYLNTVVNLTSGMTRTVTEEDREVLKQALLEVADELTKHKGALLDKTSSHGFSQELIDDVVKNSSKIFTVSDILFYSPVFSVEHALLILDIVKEIFLDVPNFDEAVSVLRQGNLSLATSHEEACLEELLMSVNLDKDASSATSDVSDLDDPDYLC